MPLTLEMNVTDRGSLGGVPGKGLDARLRAFVLAVREARNQAAQTATATSRLKVKRTRDLAPPRRNRYHGLQDAVEWRPIKPDGVSLNIKKLDAEFPPWLVQEIGTGERAIQRVGGTANPRGRPAAGAKYVRTVQSQVGRKIKPSLVFAAPGGQYAAPDASNRTQQLWLRSKVKGAPIRFDSVVKRSVPGITIKREIPAQNYIQAGSKEGFREYRQSVLTAARRQLRKRIT